MISLALDIFIFSFKNKFLVYKNIEEQYEILFCVKETKRGR
jgi:hypothetical protein